jgi:hypothetical protein
MFRRPYTRRQIATAIRSCDEPSRDEGDWHPQHRTPLIAGCGGMHSYLASSELWLATSFHEPSCRAKVSVDRIVRPRCSP